MSVNAKPKFARLTDVASDLLTNGGFAYWNEATDTLIAGTAPEPALGNPASDGYVLSSTAAGVRSWIEMTGGGVSLSDANTWTAPQIVSVSNAAHIPLVLKMAAAQSANGFELRDSSDVVKGYWAASGRLVSAERVHVGGTTGPGIRVNDGGSGGIDFVNSDASAFVGIKVESLAVVGGSTTTFAGSVEVANIVQFRNGTTALDIVTPGASAWQNLKANAFNTAGGGYSVSGTQVVGAQGAAVADATDSTDVITQLNTLLARLRSHGIIAT